MNASIYAIVNRRNGHCYIGSTTNVRKRKSNHFSALRRGDHHSQYLQRAYRSYGRSAFSFDVIDKCPEKYRDSVEQFYLSVLAPAYNISEYANHPPPMYGNDNPARRPEVRRKISRAKKNNNPGAYKAGHQLSEDARARLSLSMAGNTNSLGRRHSIATKRKISSAIKEHWKTRRRND